MTVIQVGLVDKTASIDPSFVEAAAAALNIQVMRDLPSIWNIQATVRYLPSASRIPSGVWPVLLVNALPDDEGGIHLDKNNQPYAKVLATPASDGWTIAASHEVIEMLIDPAGNRLKSSISIKIESGKIVDGDTQFDYLVEGCDPVEADNCSYSIQGVAVSDFITPHFYDPVAKPGTQYSFNGKIDKPREVLPGGYISWIDPQTDRWQQLQYFDTTGTPTIVDLGPAPADRKSLREWVHERRGPAPDGLRTTLALSQESKNDRLMEECRRHREVLRDIAERRSTMY
ncbi:hypothetical protein WM03_01770 [Burkholderia ubonensis]|uniref:hypothetical protein n=1 Tax=Burkholderia ubonensis TaxID=101571 RepID=UPI00075CA8CA|nr:hypothetical protein [Burkholderia ubonensis]KVC73171.1 hypothetical protein WI75_22285 [Burkholderia ubonensis]KVG69911.1 hypothetical protein WJ34_29975 [Burkholderia ubonensis]KVH18923.1 hypothetical protein WJ37_23350 [Burkholderia ubonensis]KVH49645.1 hypothetical protein WJ38_15125 [Burkholderia ubonensis]KVH86680.1 hypothetical protein WJ43_06720 [Burkholderia ubonensis]